MRWRERENYSALRKCISLNFVIMHSCLDRSSVIKLLRRLCDRLNRMYTEKNRSDVMRVKSVRTIH